MLATRLRLLLSSHSVIATRTITILFLLTLSFIESDAQKIIRLSRPKKDSTKFFYLYILPGENVKCKFNGGFKTIGTLRAVTPGTFMIDDHTFSFDSLQRIGTYKRAAPYILVGGYVAGVALVASAPGPKLLSLALVGVGELILVSRLGRYAGTVNLKKCRCALEIVNLEELPRNSNKRTTVWK